MGLFVRTARFNHASRAASRPDPSNLAGQRTLLTS